MRKILYALGSLLVFLAPTLSAYALTIVPCTGSECKACNLIDLANNVINFLIVVSVLIATILFAWAGFIMVTSAGNMSKVKKAKDIFVDVLIGIIIVLSGWIIINTIMGILVGDTLYGGSWKTLECVENAPLVEGPPQESGGERPDPSDPGGPTTGPLAPGSAASIAEAMANGTGMSTAAGPGGGTVACAWAVNNILGAAGVAPLDANWVPSMEAALTGGRGDRVDQTNAKAGDIVIQAGGSHVGICQNNGCTSVVSNSSSKAKFNWVSNTSFAPSYNGGPGRIYRVK